MQWVMGCPFPSFFPLLSLSSLPLEVGPLNTARGSGERCKLPQWGLGRSPSRQTIWCILSQKGQLWWQQFLWSFARIYVIFCTKIINLQKFCPKLSHDYMISCSSCCLSDYFEGHWNCTVMHCPTCTMFIGI